MHLIYVYALVKIGLYDAFILSGAYKRTSKGKDTSVRINETIKKVGVSIFTTKLTSILVFALGTISSVPVVIWLCQYTVSTIFFGFVFQLTFFVPLIVIDEQRVKDKRRDCLFCTTVTNRVVVDEPELQENRVDLFMSWYCNFLMIPHIRVLVIFLFLLMFAGLAYSASLLEQSFDFTDMLPKPSYLADYVDSLEKFNNGVSYNANIYFRYVDQSDVSIQRQMEEYVNRLVLLDSVSSQPALFWLRDFQSFVEKNDLTSDTFNSFNKQLDNFLSIPVYHALHKDDIVRDKQGNILASRTKVRLDADNGNVTNLIEALKNQQKVTTDQAVNKDREDMAFFIYDQNYLVWQFYSVAVYELILTSVIGITTISVIGMIFIPHWSAIFFIFPTISSAFVDLMGVLQLAGISINAVSYVSLVMSVGLMVDYLIHMQLRYYESEEITREDKVKDTIRTMGTSILLGGISTFLGILPLGFSTSDGLYTIFVTFIGLVTLGIGHGLILLPVILSIFGPTVNLDLSGKDTAGQL